MLKAGMTNELQNLTLKADIFLKRGNKVLTFDLLWIICQVDDSHEMQSLLFFEK